MTYFAPVLGLLAGVVGVADTIPYVRDTVGGSTRPHRGTWLIWSVLAIVVCLSQRADGASWSLIMAAAQAVLTSAVFLLSIRHGEGGLSPADVLLITLAGAGVVGWIVSDEPVIATACVVAADLIGAAMMVPKTYRDPGSETLATFALASLSGALAAGAVGAPDPSLLLYPAYFCLVNGAIAVLIHHRRSLLGATGWRGLGCSRPGTRSGWAWRPRRRLRWQPGQPARQVPVAVAEQDHGRREQHAADDRGVEQDGDREADAELLELLQGQRAENSEHGDHDDGCAGHHAGGDADAVRDCLRGRHPAVVCLLDP